MELPKVLLIGKAGQVGWELRRTLAPIGRLVCVDYPEIDLAQGDSIRQWVRSTSPEIVINAAAYTAVDKAETETDRAMKINGVAPGILAEEAKRIRALLVHYSTDYVYDGTKTEPYVEEDHPNPLSAYGTSKLAGDVAIQQVDGDHLIFRLCWVYGARGNNFLLTMMRLARERETLRVVEDQIGSPTWSRMIAEATALVLASARPAAVGPLRTDAPTRRPLNREFKGIYHLAASGSTSWHGFAEAIIALLRQGNRKCRQVEAITTVEYPRPAKRPAHSVLSCEKLKCTFGLKLPGWDHSLAQVLEETS